MISIMSLPVELSSSGANNAHAASTAGSCNGSNCVSESLVRSGLVHSAVVIIYLNSDRVISLSNVISNLLKRVCVYTQVRVCIIV